MENQSAFSDACNIEISMGPEPHLEITQDLELLAQEIAEAAVEEERRSSSSSSPTPSQSQLSDFSCDEILDAEKHTDTENPDLNRCKEPDVKEEEEEEEEEGTTPDNVSKKKHERGRSQSPVDEASWEIVDSVTELNIPHDEDSTPIPSQNHCIMRKYIGSHDLWQKLKDLGMACEICNDHSTNNENDFSSSRRFPGSSSGLDISCTESMVICNMPEQDGEASVEEEVDQFLLPLRNFPDHSNLPVWKGRISGGRVVVELERLGDLLVASVRVNHTDLLSALSSLQQLAASAGLVSYADVDVQSILARAA